ncbi:hypothetical protein HDE_01072 [Halotydeus destructor]|nr:hypothetical protein HDE_01072 [Halotydeus destructor]
MSVHGRPAYFPSSRYVCGTLEILGYYVDGAFLLRELCFVSRCGVSHVEYDLGRFDEQKEDYCQLIANISQGLHLHLGEKDLGRDHGDLKTDILKLCELNNFGGPIPFIAVANLDAVGPLLTELEIPWVNMLNSDFGINSLAELSRSLNVPFYGDLHWYTTPTQKRYSGLLCAKRLAKQIYKFIEISANLWQRLRQPLGRLERYVAKNGSGAEEIIPKLTRDHIIRFFTGTNRGQ